MSELKSKAKDISRILKMVEELLPDCSVTIQVHESAPRYQATHRYRVSDKRLSHAGSHDNMETTKEVPIE